MRDSIYHIYHALQQNKFFLSIIAWLQQHYVTVIIGDFVNLPINIRNRNHPEKYLSKSRKYFENNKNRIDTIKNILADEQSRIAYDAAIKFRTESRRLKKNEWSLTDQYFVDGIISLHENEVFIDGGAYNGDTIDKLLKFERLSKGKASIKRVIAFEPVELNFNLLAKKYKKNPKIVLVQAGLSKEKGICTFSATGSSSRIIRSEKKGNSISVYAIDEMRECDDVTFIKMDIEGAEWDALHGAEKTILKNKPKLAICIYHSDEDMIRLIEYIHNLVPEYRLYVRQHTRRNHETVLYAV